MKRLYRGYDGVADIFRTSSQQNYTFGFDIPTEITDLKTASIAAAQEFGLKYQDREIMILYSGGLDSEWLCESFFLAGVPFTPVIVRYSGSDNEHDLKWATRYLERRQLLQRTLYWDFDLRGWYGSNEQFEIAENSQLSELAYTGQFKAMLELNRPDRIFLNGYDEPVITAADDSGQRQWNLTYNERHYAVHKFSQHYGIPTQQGGWVNSSVFAAYVNSPVWQLLVANLVNPLIWNSELLKVNIYQKAFPFLEARPKYTGFENMLDVVVPATKKWRSLLKAKHDTLWLQEWRRPIKEVWLELKGMA